MRSLIFSILFLALLLFFNTTPQRDYAKLELHTIEPSTYKYDNVFLPTMKKALAIIERRLKSGIKTTDFLLIGGKVKTYKSVMTNCPEFPIENRTSRKVNPELHWEPG